MTKPRKGSWQKIYLDVVNEKNSYEGIALVLDYEERETFLVTTSFEQDEDKRTYDLYQKYRLHCKFLPQDKLPEKYQADAGRLNDKFLSEPLVTHKIKRFLVKSNVSSDEITDLDFTPGVNKFAVEEPEDEDEDDIDNFTLIDFFSQNHNTNQHEEIYRRTTKRDFGSNSNSSSSFSNQSWSEAFNQPASRRKIVPLIVLNCAEDYDKEHYRCQ